GVGDPALDVLVDPQVKGGKEVGPADEDEVVILGEVLKEDPQLAQVGQVHQVGVVENGGQGFAGVVEAEGLFDEPAFALEGVALKLDPEGLTQDFYRVGIGMQSAGDGGDHVLVFGEALQGLLEDRLAGAGHAEDEAQSSLLTMDFEGVVNL